MVHVLCFGEMWIASDFRDSFVFEAKRIQSWRQNFPELRFGAMDGALPSFEPMATGDSTSR